jgi:hypothetical protein
MQLQCPSCSAKVLADDVNLGTRLAKCRGCNDVFAFAVPSPASQEAAAPRPSKFKVLEREGELEISWRWFNASHIFMAFFCAAWDVFLVFWYTIAFTKGPAGFHWIAILFPIAHVAVGVGLTYATLAGFWNRTTVRVVRERLSIAHGPVPWFGNRSIRAGELRRLQGSLRPGHIRNGAPVYQLVAVTQMGEEIRLLSGLQDSTQALFLEQQIGRFLDLRDQPPSEMQ